MVRPYDRRKSLDELEGESWGEADYDSQLAKTVHRLRTKPVGEFTVEDLRVMIGQRISLVHLVPLAIEALEREPLAEGDFYPGDLLASVLKIDSQFWEGEWEYRDRLRKVLLRIRRPPESLEKAIESFNANAG